MSRPAQDVRTSQLPRICHHVVATMRDGTTKTVGTRASEAGAIAVKSQFRNAPNVVSIDIEPRHWCTCSN